MTAASQGATNRRMGHETERRVVRWLRQVGWPAACTTRAKLGHDGWSAPGDVSFHPLIVLEVKDVQSGSRWPTWCRQAVAASAPGQVPCVVRRTRGNPDVAAWETRVQLAALHELGVVLVANRLELVDGEPWAVTDMAALAAMVRGIDA